MCPISFFIVYKSSRVWVGCWPAPSPAFITGTSTISDMNLDTPSSSCLMTNASLYPSNIFAVSAMLSPFDTELDPLFSNPMQSPPKRFMAVSKDIFVLVEGSKNINPRSLPFKSSDTSFDLAMFSSLYASFKMYSMSSLSKSFIEIMFFNLKILINPFINHIVNVIGKSVNFIHVQDRQAPAIFLIFFN